MFDSTRSSTTCLLLVTLFFPSDRFKVGQNFLLISIAYQKQPTAKDLFLFLFNNYGDKWTSGMKLINTAFIDDIRSIS